jgi:hypothetical protein
MMLKYAWAALAILVAVNSVMFPWLDGPERAGLLVAAAITFPVQVLAFALLAKHTAHPVEGLVVWIGTGAVRMGIVVAVGLSLTWFPGLSPVTTLLGCAGFFFVLLMLEPVFLAARVRAMAETA